VEPRARLLDDLRATFVIKERYAKVLFKLGSLVEAALSDTPPSELVLISDGIDSGVLKDLYKRIASIQRMLDLSDWFRTHADQWLKWWRSLAGSETTKEGEVIQLELQSSLAGTSQSENLSAHLSRLSNALAKADPYRKAAESMRTAWKSGKLATEIENEVKHREAIAESLSPLKSRLVSRIYGSIPVPVMRQAYDREQFLQL
jgi:hypothetical protein